NTIFHVENTIFHVKNTIFHVKNIIFHVENSNIAKKLNKWYYFKKSTKGGFSVWDNQIKKLILQ
ncbi:hypothetical protein M1V76_28660, partial [Klebsiella pneumoniae]|nr:hypothetical protein [Klebsiella pneumoniae]